VPVRSSVAACWCREGSSLRSGGPPAG
jgi:hypothetical protein